MLCRRGYVRSDRAGTIVGLKGDNYVVQWDGNAKETVKSYARRFILIIPSATKASPS